MKRVALYARVSTRDQHADMQIAELRTKARHMGWEIVAERIDCGSGKNGAKLPERQRLVDDVHRGRIDIVVVWRFDRFARSTVDLLQLLECFRSCNVEFVSLRDNVDTSTATGKLIFTFIAAIAEFERELIRERVKAGIANAKSKGTRFGRPRVEVAIDEARTLLSSGASLRSVARTMRLPVRTLRRRLQEAGHKPCEIRPSENGQSGASPSVGKECGKW